MKYNVTLSYHGSLSVEIDADSEQSALEAARAHVGAMSDTEFNNAIGLMEDDHDVEVIGPDPFESWKKPRFTEEHILTPRLHFEKDDIIDSVKDSMELDSGGRNLVCLRNDITTRSGGRLLIDAFVRVQGDVRVYFKGECYRCASDMPRELLDCYHNSEDPLELDHEYSCSMNNWFEEFIAVYDLDNGVLIHEQADVIDTVCDVDWKKALAEDIVIALNDDNDCLGFLFKEDDQVRWDDPDPSLPDQMDPDELEEYRNREFCICTKHEEFAAITDGDTEAEVPYSQLLLEEA